MEPKDHNELPGLLARLGIVNGQARHLAEDIAVGDELLARDASVGLSPAARERINAAVRRKLNRRVWKTWAVRAAAAVLIVLIPLLIISPKFSTPRSDQTIAIAPGQSDIFTDEALWELALEGNNAQPGVDELAYSEFSLSLEQQS